jgi:hypothetical protein
MPSGIGEADPEGLRFYHDVLDECRSLGISVYATLYHWDLPAPLDDGKRKGWLDPDIVGWFLAYATRVIQEYDSKVAAWFTINEPLTTSAQGYGTTCGFAPGRCSRENMLVSAHLQLLAHAAVAGYYLEHYPGGRIGIVLLPSFALLIFLYTKAFISHSANAFLLYCNFFYYGLMPDGNGTKASVAGPAKRAEVAILHAVKALGSAQTNFAGGQGYYNFLTFLAPYLEGISYNEIKQLMQMFVYEMTQMMVARGGQLVFSSIQLSPGNMTAHVGLVSTYSMIGRENEARAEADEILRLNPKFSVETYGRRLPYKDQKVIDDLVSTLRKAGLK